jgi:alpha-tubulin suppressor-like RCC1 family protein
MAGLKSDGSAWAWGPGSTYGALGQGTVAANRSSPVSVVGGHSFVSLSAGLSHSIGAKSDGSAWAWGRGNAGQLGQGTTAVDRSSPVSVVGGISFTSVVAIGDGSFGLSNGIIWTWGYNSGGRLGDGTTEERSSPVLVHTNQSNFTALSANGSRVAALRSDGAIFSWGGSFSERSGATLTPISVAQIFH